MKPERQFDILEKNLARKLAWISAADSRVAPLFAINTTMLGVVAALLPKSALWEKFPLVTAVLTLICLGASLVCIFLTTIPRTDGPKSSLLYFGGVAQKDADQYLKAIQDQNDDDYLKDLAHQVHRNAEIAAIKFKWIGRAMLWTLVGSLPWLATIFLLYQKQ